MECAYNYYAVMDEIERKEEEEEEVTVDPEREAYYKDDPKKALKKYFDREGVYMHVDMQCVYAWMLG